MCGIAGFIALRNQYSRDELERLGRQMGDSIFHRGPDAGGTWVDETKGVVFANRRLAIVDLSEMGAQPMVSASGRFVIAYNGEIYNTSELRQKLEQTGQTFRGHSDTEVLLEAISAWGVEATLRQTNGMFAFALWDREDSCLILARDHLGIKPLYWQLNDGLLLFGSELRALQAHPGFAANIDRTAAAQFLRYGMIPGQMSIFTGVAKVKPGTFVQFSPKTGGSVRDVTYWSVVDCIASGGRDQFRGDLQDAVDATGSLLADTVKRQMISDVPVGAFLSGGIDSSLVTALMRNNSTQPIHTYCIGFAEDNYNEAQHAAKIAQYLETDHTEFLLTPEDVLGIIPDLHLISDEPFADSSQVPTALLCRLTKGHVKVALSGDGGDEIFGGYTQYLSTQKISALLNYGPPFLKRLGARALHALPASTWETLLTLPGRDQPLASGEKMYLLAEILAAPKDQLHRALYSRWRDMEAILPGVEEPDDPFSAPDLVAAAPNLLDRLMGVDIQYGLPDRMLTKVDRASMASSLEVRVPLLDHRLVEFAWRLPQKMKMSHGVGKHVLRQLLYRSVPQSLVDRPKQGFSFPLAEWLRGPLKPWAQNLLSKDAIRSNGLLVPATIDLVWQQHLSGSRNHHNLIWHVLMLQSWCNGQKTLGR